VGDLERESSRELLATSKCLCQQSEQLSAALEASGEQRERFFLSSPFS
jgi:hypothetical protein